MIRAIGSFAKGRSLTIRTKLAVFLTILIGVISLFIVLFFPARQERQALGAMTEKARSIAEMTAYSISPGLYFEDHEAVAEVINSASLNDDLRYIVVLDGRGQIFDIYRRKAPGNDGAIPAPVNNQIFADGQLYQAMTPIVYDGRRIGRLFMGFSLANIQAEMGESKTTIALISLLVFLIGMAAVFGISTIITNPLSRIVETVERISEGDLSRRAVVPTEDEVGHLARSFNRMVDNLEVAQGQLQELNRTLERRVEERTRELRQEIAERRLVEDALKASEANYRAIFDAVSDAIFVHDIDTGAILDVNEKMSEMYGYTVEEARRLNVGDISGGGPKFAQGDALKRISEATKGIPQLFEWLGKDKSGRNFWVEVSLKRAQIGGCDRLLAVVRDIAERKQADEMLKRSEEEYRSLVENISDGVLTTDLDDRILFANQASCRIFGLGLGDLLGLDLKGLVAVEEIQRVAAETQKRVIGESGQYELTIERKDGTARRIFVSAAPLQSGDGLVKGSINVCTDVTELKVAESEKQELRDKLARAQRMESLGVLAGGVAHDLNNILGPLVAYPEVIRLKLPPDSPALGHIKKIEASAQRAAEVVQDLLTMARRGRYEMSPVNINDMISSYLQSPDFGGQRSKYASTDIQVRLTEDIPLIYGSASHLSKVIMNLVINALEAMPRGGALSIATEVRFIEELISGFGNIESRNYVIMSIRDTGHGISDKDMKQIFEPFYSKKEMGRSGSGLGLAIVYGVVKDHNGYIDVRSKVGEGSEFIIYLPVAEIAKSEIRKEVIDIRGSERILVVDDVIEQRELAAAILGSLGYNVETAANGHEAVERIKSVSPDVVLLDMIMEDDFDGLDTYREIIKHRPGQKAIIASGFAETDRVKEAEMLGVGKYVRKPYTMQAMGKSIREVLSN